MALKNCRSKINEFLGYCLGLYGDAEGKSVFEFYNKYFFLPYRTYCITMSERRKKHLKQIIDTHGKDHVKNVILDILRYSKNMTSGKLYNERYLTVALENFDRLKAKQAADRNNQQQKAKEFRKANYQKQEHSIRPTVSTNALTNNATPIRHELKYPEEELEYNKFTYLCPECNAIIESCGKKQCTCGLEFDWSEVV